MSTISVRLPDSLYRRIKALSEKEHVSMNQLITLAIAEKISVLETDNYLQKRAARADEKAFRAVLTKVPKVVPPDYNKL